jgi:cellulose synthase/poly-beta-1,6-N-acetylglucosamine synthase-like glycosyltransferase
VPTVSVVVPVLNAAPTISATLAALGDQRFDGEYEVIVVDCGSTDGTLALLNGAAVTVLHHPERDPAGARNRGAEHAHSELLAFTDADCAPEAGWLAAGVAALHGADLVQGRVLPARAPGPLERTVSVGAEHGLYETANLLVRRQAFDRAGGFGPVPGLALAPGRHFGEDTWFAWRARRAGARTAFAPDAVVRHAVFPRSPGAFVAERQRAAYFPALVAAVPELRTAFLHRRLFLSPASLRFDLALLGATASRRRRAGWLLALPWAADTARRARRDGAGAACATAAADALTAAALVAGSVRYRTPVL